MSDLLNSTYDVAAVDAAMVLVREWAGRSFEMLDMSVPLSIVTALPFVVLILWAALQRDVLLVVAVAILAWLGVARFFEAAPPSLGLLELAAAWVVALLLCIYASWAGRRRMRLHGDLRQVQARLEEIARDLDRERFWRRAGGDMRSSLDDDEIRALMERLGAAGGKHLTGPPSVTTR
ncbi:hypothetical protein [Antarcticirhabdus aurantiaca]|uniref:Uncharacterized protein n=1 Tax=Antarcticirhabdus aurantiaca TaxID=2606717 RepID=A0ACD4NQS6_9HYPH|nr:hypothetical protein [Antarcticirhabdus aurantiaca]WAJ29184.1 hypothetical protein OXU80_02785 [Jeongeuplla avenae]